MVYGIYIYCHSKNIPISFHYDHQNDVHWGAIYVAQIMQIPEEMEEELVKGICEKDLKKTFVRLILINLKSIIIEDAKLLEAL